MAYQLRWLGSEQSPASPSILRYAVYPTASSFRTFHPPEKAAWGEGYRRSSGDPGLEVHDSLREHRLARRVQGFELDAVARLPERRRQHVVGIDRLGEADLEA